MQQVDPEYIERRKYPRLTINAGLTFIKNSGAAPFSGFCRNLSHSGIFFDTEHVLSIGESVTVTLDTKSGSFSPLTVKVNVIRIEPSENKHTVAGEIVEYR